MTPLDPTTADQAAVAEGIVAISLAMRGIIDAVAGRPADDEARAAVEHIELLSDRLGKDVSLLVLQAVAVMGASQHISTPSQVYELLRHAATHIARGNNPTNLTVLLPIYAKLMVKRDAAAVPEVPIEPTSTANGADTVEFGVFGYA